MLIVEMNDTGLLARGGTVSSARAVAASPGYALIEDGSMVTGRAALESARLRPRRIHNRFWNELDASPLLRPFPTDLRSADLAHAHLADLWGQVHEDVTEVILALPGTASAPQLGLTLGIARACGMPVNGMVDAAVAAAASGVPGRRLLHLDLELHRVVATAMLQEHGIVRREVRFSSDTGLASLHDRWARRIAEIFVSCTRLDPLHGAVTEQELYLALPEILRRSSADGRVPFELRSSGTTYSVELTRENLAGAVARQYEVFVHLAGQADGEGAATLLLSSRVAGLPGLTQLLARTAKAEPVVLAEDAAARGAHRYRQAIQSPDDALPFITRLGPTIITPAPPPAWIEDHGTPQA